MEETYNYAVVGAGVSALAFARLVSPSNLLIIEKSRGIGGRLATRRLGEFWINHGPSSLEVVDPVLCDMLEAAPPGVFSIHEHTYHAILPITSWTKKLARDFQVKTECKVDYFSRCPEGYELFDDQNNHICFAQNIIVCTPAPQAREILSKSNLEATFLDDVAYESCIQFMALLENELPPEKMEGDFYSLQMRDCPKKGFYLYHFEVKEEFKTHYLELDKEEIKDAFQSSLKLDQYSVIDTHAHKWKYSTVKQTIDSKYQFTFKDQKVWLAGDYFFGSDLNAAVASAKALSIR